MHESSRDVSCVHFFGFKMFSNFFTMNLAVKIFRIFFTMNLAVKIFRIFFTIMNLAVKIFWIFFYNEFGCTYFIFGLFHNFCFSSLLPTHKKIQKCYIYIFGFETSRNVSCIHFFGFKMFSIFFTMNLAVNIFQIFFTMNLAVKIFRIFLQ